MHNDKHASLKTNIQKNITCCVFRLAFPVWLIAMILMHVVIRYGGYMSILTSLCLFTANIIYACVRNPLELKVPFEDATLEFHWGWAFWLNIFNGNECIMK